MTRDELLRLLQTGLDASPEYVGGGLLLCHRRSVAPLAYLHRIYPVLTQQEVSELESRLARPIPADHRAFLQTIGNGARFYSAFGLNGLVRRIDRSMGDGLGQPISLDYGNVNERPRGLDDDTVAIGGMVGWSSRGVLVMDRRGSIALVHPVDGQDVAASWDNLDNMLRSEIARLSPLHDSSGRSLVADTALMHPGGQRWETKPEPARPAKTSKLLSILGRFRSR